MGSLIWFVAIVAMIPVALWLLKRTPMGGGGAGQGVLRSVAALPLSTNQRIVTVEVGQGEARRWLVLGVTAQSITTLHTMEPQDDSTSVRADASTGSAQGTPGGVSKPLARPFDASGRTGFAGSAFAQLLGKLRQDRGHDGR
jgi:flagellar protein FliO/FliZ